MTPRTRNYLVFAAKAVLAAVLIGWLLRSGNLELSALGILIERPPLLALNAALFALGTVIGSVRFGVLLRIAKVDAPLWKLFLLQMMAFFVNLVIPGNIGGDVLKGLHVAREAPPSKRTTILLLVFVERLLGLVALILVGTIVIVFRGRVLWDNPLLRPLAMTVTFLGATLVAGGLLFFLVVGTAGARLDVYTSGPSKISKLLNQLVLAMRLVSTGPRQILIALVLSMAFHAAAIGYFTVLTHALVDPRVPYSAIATVFPLGLLSLMLPISPSGLGVGHVAFKKLFEAIGLAGGANVWNVYLLGQLAPCLLGVFPFLSLRRSGALPTDVAEAASKTESTV